MFNVLSIGTAIVEALRTVFAQIAFIIYDCIVIVYDLFMYISKAEFLDNDLVLKIYESVGMILGIFMIFKLIFSLINSLIDPNKFSDKKTGFTNLIIRMILSIVMLGIVPTIFKEAYKVQNLLVGNNDGSQNIFYKLIIGNSVKGGASSFGKTLSTELYFSFYTDEEYPFLPNSADPEDGFASSSEKAIDNLREEILKSEDVKFKTTMRYLNETSDGGDYFIEFNFIFIVVVGVVILWILFMYCFQVAARVFQLAFLQLVAPIPILSYISDPDGSFKKWIKQCVSTYLDLFLRLCIIYFIVLLATNILDQLNDAESILITSLGNIKSGMLFFVRTILMIGLLLFALKVPNLIKDLFPNLGGGAGKFSFGLNPKKELFDPISKSLPGKIVGAGINKSFGLYDRLRFHSPKPRGKMGQYFDKVMPGRASMIKDRRQADIDMKGLQSSWNRGKSIAERLGNTKLDANTSDATFSSLGFHDEWVQAYKNESRAKSILEEYQDKLLMAQASGDANLVKKYSEEVRAKQGAYNMTQKELEIANKKFSSDARKMSDYKLYTKNMNRKPGTSVSQQPMQQSSVSQISQPSFNSQSQQKSAPENRVINEKTSMFANMSDAEFNLRQSENYDVANTNPNDYFDALSDVFVEDYSKNNESLSEKYSRDFDTQWNRMEDAYKNAGWKKGSDGKWTKDN